MISRFVRPWLLTLGLAAAAPVPAQVEEPSAALRAEFLLAYNLARAGAPALPESGALRSYILYPYLEATRLSHALVRAGPDWSDHDDAARELLARYDGEPVTFNLRAAWLSSLARRELWPALREHYRADAADAALRCQNLRARIALGDTVGIAPAILDEWLTPRQLPGECEPVFEWLRDAGPLDVSMTEARVRLLLENGQAAFARVIARRLPEERGRPLFAWADLIERPLSTIETYVAMPSGMIDGPMLLDGWSRLARDNPSAALALHDVLVTTEGLDRERASPYTLALALGLAWDRRPEALEYFARVAPDDMDDYALGWQARAALWARDFETARTSIAAMSAEQRGMAQWRYWAARTSADDAAADALYASILPDDNYFSAAAAAQIRDRAALHPEARARDPATMARLSTIPAVMRAAELWRVRLPVAAAREWRHASAAFARDEREQSIHVAMDLEWFDLAVATATELGIFYDYGLLYPRPYAAEVEAAADEFDLKPALIRAVMRQESLYRADAESSAGAQGLMQLMRGTAGDIARDLGESRGDLLDPAVNIRLGAARLARLIERYDGNVVPALAAYNAGPAAVDRWLPEAPLDGDVWLENVPFNETREYVRRVLWHTVVFEWLEDDRVNARDWLREIGPR